jgi:transcriptional regulator with XRE-family HTH domain
MTFGQVFKNARKEARKTLREAAEHVQMSIGNISDIEHSRRRPPREEILSELEKFYGLQRNYLVQAAKREWKIPDDAISIYSKRPELTMSLLRASSSFSNSELRKIIERFSGRSNRRA